MHILVASSSVVRLIVGFVCCKSGMHYSHVNGKKHRYHYSLFFDDITFAYVTTHLFPTLSLPMFHLYSANVDYMPLNQAEVVFQSGASAQLNSTSCINFTIIDDNVLENNETVPLSLSSISPVNTLLTSSTATVMIYETSDCEYYSAHISNLALMLLITDVTLGFPSPYYVVEGINSTATICVVVLDGMLGRSVTVQATTVSFTALRK